MDLMESIGAFADKIDQVENENTLQLDSMEIEPSLKGFDNITIPRYHN